MSLYYRTLIQMSVDPLPTITSTSSVFIIGDFSTYGEPYIKERSIIRLNQDGSKDETFDNLDAFAVGTSISKVRLLSDNNYAVYSGSAVSYKGSVASNLHIIDNSGNRVNTHNAYNATYSVGTSILSVFGATDFVYDQSVGGTHSGKIYAYGISGTMGGLTFSGLLRLNPDWTIDTSFNTYISSTQSGFSTGTVAVVKILSDGNLIVGGKITTFKGSGSYMNGNGICKLDTDGNIIPWTISAPITSSTTECVLDILETSNGDLFVGGAWTHYNGLTSASNLKIMKLQSNGTKITSFTNQSGSNTVTFKKFHLRSDGNLLALCGGTLVLSNSFSGGLIVLDPTTGALVTSFQKGYGLGSSLNNTKFIVYNNSIILKNNSSGYSWDKSFTGGLVKLDLTTAELDVNFKKSVNNTGLISDIVVDQNGKIVVVGSFKYWKRPNMHAVKIAPNGSLDPTFDTGIVNPPYGGATQPISSSFKDNLGNIYIYGVSTEGYDNSVYYLNGAIGAPNLPNSNYPSGIVKITATGSHRTEFLPVMNLAKGGVAGACTDNNGFVYAVGSFTRNTDTTNGLLISHIAKLSATTGLVDSTFRINSGNGFRAGLQETSGVTYTIAYDQVINKLYVGGAFTSYNNTGQTASRIARLNTDGTFDSSFNTYISSTQSGYNNNVLLISLDRTGGPNDGKIYVYGPAITTYKGATVSSITRLNPDGSLDTTFLTASPNNTVFSILPLQSGGLFIGGNISLYNNVPVNKIVKLNSDGTIDTSFNTGTGFEYIPLNDTNLTYALQYNAIVRVIKYDPADKIYVGGYFGKYNGVPKNCIVRLNMDGSIDTTFNDGGYGLQANTTTSTGGVYDITVI